MNTATPYMFETKIIKVNPITPEKEAIALSTAFLRRGEIVAFPTETVYGLGADSTNRDAVLKIFKAKARPPDNPLIIHTSSLEQLKLIAAEIPERAFKAAEKLWPGPLTIILRSSGYAVDEARAGLPTVAVRMPAHPVALAMIEGLGRPVAAPSANRSGRPSPTSAQHVLHDLIGLIPLVLDGGETLYGVESTIIDMTKEPSVLLRPGPLTPEELKNIVGEIVISKAAKALESYEEVVISPGLKYRHYAPAKPMILICSTSHEKILEKMRTMIAELQEQGKRVGILISRESLKDMEGVYAEVEVTGSRENLFEVAHNLYYSLRSIDLKPVDIILCEGYIEKGLGLTVMNRLRKASGYNVVYADGKEL